MKNGVIFCAALFGAVAPATGRLEAQALYAGVRVGAASPTGSFADDSPRTGSDALLHGATPGLGFGFDAGIGSPLIGLYGGYDRIHFDCTSASCATSGKYELTGVSAGFRVSVPLLPLVKPWAKAGVTYNELKTSVNGTAMSTGRRPGYEVGAGVDIPVLLGFFSLTPQIRRVRQKLSLGGSRKSADYNTFDIGLRVRTPI